MSMAVCMRLERSRLRLLVRRVELEAVFVREPPSKVRVEREQHVDDRLSARAVELADDVEVGWIGRALHGGRHVLDGRARRLKDSFVASAARRHRHCHRHGGGSVCGGKVGCEEPTPAPAPTR
eukprot:2270780-Prymnesium_polylepis.1